MTPQRNDRVRFRFSKYGRIRFTSHRDLARIWERSLRRGRVPVAYSEGFSPRPRLRFGLALATAYESNGEYLDVDLPGGTIADGSIDVDDLVERIAPLLPAGMAVQAAAPVAPGTPSLQEAVTSCTWLVEVPGLTAAEADDLVSTVLAARELPVTRTRKGKDVTDDVRPAVCTLRVADDDDRPPAADWQPAGAMLLAELGTQPRACRPSELLAAVDPTLEEGRVVRLHQWTTVDGVRCEPLPLGPGASAAPVRDGLARPSATHATVRAS